MDLPRLCAHNFALYVVCKDPKSEQVTNLRTSGEDRTHEVSHVGVVSRIAFDRIDCGPHSTRAVFVSLHLIVVDRTTAIDKWRFPLYHNRRLGR